MTPEEAIKIVKAKSRGRTRYEGQPDYLDEVLVAEIERLEKECEQLRQAIGLATTAVPDMEMDVNDPIGMMQQIVTETKRLKEIIKELKHLHKTQLNNALTMMQERDEARNLARDLFKLEEAMSQAIDPDWATEWVKQCPWLEE